MKQIELPGLIEQAWAFLSAARNSDAPEVRSYYGARARCAFTAATTALDELKLNLEILERDLPQGKAQNDG